MADAKSNSKQELTEEAFKTWANSPKGKARLEELNKNANERRDRNTPGTPEYYQEWKAQRDALDEWDSGSFI